MTKGLNNNTSYIERNLKPGSYIYWHRQEYRITDISADKMQIHMENLDSAESISLALMEILTPTEDSSETFFAATLDKLRTDIAQALPRQLASAYINLPQTFLNRAEMIIQTVEMVNRMVNEEERRARLYNEEFHTTAALKRALSQLDADHSICMTTFYKYKGLVAKYDGNSTKIAASLRPSTYNQTKMNETQLHFIDTLIMRYYASPQPIRRKTLFNLSRDILKRTHYKWPDPKKCHGKIPLNLIDELLNHKLPMQFILDNAEKAQLLSEINPVSQSWLYEYVSWFEKQPNNGREIINTRYGDDTWEREFMVFDTYVNLATKPLQYVFADHHLVDVFVVDEETRSHRDRLWLTLLIDVYTRSILGFNLLYETPRIESIQDALHHAIWPKNMSDEGIEAEGDWPVYGIPHSLSLDNAWAHHSHTLENLSRDISRGGKFNSIELDFRPPYKARYGGIIERSIGGFSDAAKQFLAGAIRSSNHKDVQNAAKEACLLYQDIYNFVYKSIIAYQNEPHSELDNLTPNEKWAEAGKRLGFPLVPPHTAEVERLFWRMLPETRQLNSKGISLFGMHYWSPDLGGVNRVTQSGKPVQYSIRFDISDISRIALFKDGNWVGDAYAKELRLPDGSYRSISFAERAMGKSMGKNKNRSNRNWLKDLNELNELNARRKIEKKKTPLKSRKTTKKQSKTERILIETTTSTVSQTKSGQLLTELLADFGGNT